LSGIFNEKQTLIIKEVALEAGEIAKKFWFARDFEISKKPDGSRVTSADIAVSKFISAKLNQHFPQFKLVCEEGDLRQVEDDFWLIDPIDGTSAFIDGSPEFAVNIAFIRNKKAAFGLIHAPLFEGQKTVLCDDKNGVIFESQNQKIFFDDKQNYSNSQLRIITSTRTKDSDIGNFIAKLYPKIGQNFTVEKLSSAVKFFRLVEGNADLYLHFRPSMEWDIAAGEAIIELMGGKVKKLNFNQDQFVIGEEMAYLKPQFANSSFLAFINEIKP